MNIDVLIYKYININVIIKLKNIKVLIKQLIINKVVEPRDKYKDNWLGSNL